MNGRWRWLALALVAVSLAGAACGDNGGAPSETPGGGTAVATLPPGPAATAIITGNLLEYPARGYRVRFPEGWNADTDVVTFASVKADAFFAPEETGGVQPSISVSREDLDAGTTAAAYLESKLQTVRGLGSEDVEVTGGLTVAGREASAIAYAREVSGLRLEKRDVVLVDDGHGWEISLTAPAGQRAQYEPLFQEFLSSFELLALSVPSGE